MHMISAVSNHLLLVGGRNTRSSCTVPYDRHDGLFHSWEAGSFHFCEWGSSGTSRVVVRETARLRLCQAVSPPLFCLQRIKRQQSDATPHEVRVKSSPTLGPCCAAAPRSSRWWLSGPPLLFVCLDLFRVSLSSHRAYIIVLPPGRPPFITSHFCC